jgi:hypothetical protein
MRKARSDCGDRERGDPSAHPMRWPRCAISRIRRLRHQGARFGEFRAPAERGLILTTDTFTRLRGRLIADLAITIACRQSPVDESIREVNA